MHYEDAHFCDGDSVLVPNKSILHFAQNCH